MFPAESRCIDALANRDHDTRHSGVFRNIQHALALIWLSPSMIQKILGMTHRDKCASHSALHHARLLMKGKTVVITGGTSGIGEVAAEALAQMGARIVLVARNKTRADATLARLGRSEPGAAHSVYFADLTRLAEMKRVAAEIANREPPIDVLINNAGALFAVIWSPVPGWICFIYLMFVW